MSIYLPPCSMLERYDAVTLNVAELQVIADMIAALPAVNVWRGPDNAFSSERWREQCCARVPEFRADAHVSALSSHHGVYVMLCTNGNCGKPDQRVNANVVDLLCLNSLPCVVLRSVSRVYEAGWTWKTGTPSEPPVLQPDTLVQLQKFQDIYDYTGDTHVQVLTKACTLRTLLQWQVDSKKTVLKEENDGQFAAPASESAGERRNE